MKTQNQRVNFARAFIISGREVTRKFDGCFENEDGDEVYTRLKEKALKHDEVKWRAAYNALCDGTPKTKKDWQDFKKLDNVKKLRENFNRYLTPID